jgi:2'-deoxynucleoside 5'-phosphate N-hydrolase
MRIYFGFTMAGDRGSLAAARRIVAILEELGHDVLTRHLVEDDAFANDRRLTPRQVYERDMAWLGQSDVLIAEVSGSSYGLGYEAGYVLGQAGRRVILCYAAAAEERISRMITGNTHPGCTLICYGSIEELEARLRAALT